MKATLDAFSSHVQQTAVRFEIISDECAINIYFLNT